MDSKCVSSLIKSVDYFKGESDWLDLVLRISSDDEESQLSASPPFCLDFFLNLDDGICASLLLSVLIKSNYKTRL